MSGFEDYARELAELDYEIRHLAAACGVDLTDPAQVETLIAEGRRHREVPEDHARLSLRGLIVLREKVKREADETG
jgi:hypothetical protein